MEVYQSRVLHQLKNQLRVLEKEWDEKTTDTIHAAVPHLPPAAGIVTFNTTQRFPFDIAGKVKWTQLLRKKISLLEKQLMDVLGVHWAKYEGSE